jgi:molybdopterin-binding protein
MKISTRNVLKGTVTQIIEGAINNEVILVLSNGLEITSVITKSSVKNLELKEGKEAYAVIKASNIMIAVND